MVKQWMVGVLAMGVFATSASSAADDSGFYVGAGFGQAYNEVGRFSLEDSVVKAFVGFTFNDYFATELTYIDPQEAEERFDDVGVQNRGQLSLLSDGDFDVTVVEPLDPQRFLRVGDRLVADVFACSVVDLRKRAAIDVHYEEQATALAELPAHQQRVC